MLYTFAGTMWSKGSPLDFSETRQAFYRTRAAAIRAAKGRAIVAVALCFDAVRGEVHARGHASRDASAAWTAPALMDHAGRITVLAVVPAFLVRSIATPSIHVHGGDAQPVRRPRIADLVRNGAP